MHWYQYLVIFVGGVFLSNGVPHFVNGISGRRFQTPFASPPGVGLSSPVINVIWGTTNFFIGLLLLQGPGKFSGAELLDWLLLLLGALAMALILAWHFGQVNRTHDS